MSYLGVECVVMCSIEIRGTRHRLFVTLIINKQLNYKMTRSIKSTFPKPNMQSWSVIKFLEALG